ncbi:chemotaxis protein CheW [Paenibacillus sp. strain BS8-2]
MYSEVQPSLEVVEDTQRGKLLTFQLENEYFAIDIKHVIEIIGIQPITNIPEMPEFIRGIINLRGNIIPVMDVRLRFGKTFRDYTDRTCIIVVEVLDLSIGLIVDRVSEVIAIPEEHIVNPPELRTSVARYVKAIGKVGDNVKLLLDCDKLINDTDASRLYTAL